MPTPKAWSHSALESFVNCPRSYYRLNVRKDIQRTQDENQLWGEWVHKQFELRVRDGVKLPPQLAEHEDFMKKLAAPGGFIACEDKIALTKDLKRTSYFAKDVWLRCVFDYARIQPTEAHIVDHKTGKPKDNPRQLSLFALTTFALYPTVQKVVTEYYWTQTQGSTTRTYLREQTPELWGAMAPDLKQYVQAWRTNTWQPRQSGLCNGWCLVTDCEFWRPKRSK